MIDTDELARYLGVQNRQPPRGVAEGQPMSTVSGLVVVNFSERLDRIEQMLDQMIPGGESDE